MKLVAEVNPGFSYTCLMCAFPKGVFLSAGKCLVLSLFQREKVTLGPHHPFIPFVCCYNLGKVVEKMLSSCLIDAIVSAGDL